ncbi:MAG: hypothetical protein ACP5KE_08245 [Candidatus Methanodesulfokora sp.]
MQKSEGIATAGSLLGTTGDPGMILMLFSIIRPLLKKQRGSMG